MMNIMITMILKIQAKYITEQINQERLYCTFVMPAIFKPHQINYAFACFRYI